MVRVTKSWDDIANFTTNGIDVCDVFEVFIEAPSNDSAVLEFTNDSEAAIKDGSATWTSETTVNAGEKFRQRYNGVATGVRVTSATSGGSARVKFIA